jgi:4-hydroxy-tetrahydrodipicolinate synthase
LHDAEELHRRLYPLFRDLFIESNPVPIKAVLARAGWMTSDVRLPLVPLQSASWEKLAATLQSLTL